MTRTSSEVIKEQGGTILDNGLVAFATNALKPTLVGYELRNKEPGVYAPILDPCTNRDLRIVPPSSCCDERVDMYCKKTGKKVMWSDCLKCLVPLVAVATTVTKK